MCQKKIRQIIFQENKKTDFKIRKKNHFNSGTWNFFNNVTIILSNEERTKIKVIDLEKLYNFIVEHFFI